MDLPGCGVVWNEGIGNTKMTEKAEMEKNCDSKTENCTIQKFCQN